ncbi:MAG: ABC transporter substrate-binding protein [Propionibacteriaceae bacterium]|nr:ABC transporter substrate-binding protein [Propionibacteriaceae bacterium]
MKRPLAIIAVAALASAVTLTGCSSNSTNPPASNGSVTLVAPGTLTVCTHLPFEPMESRDASGTVVGFDFDWMNLVAAQLGVTVSVVEIDPAQMSSGAAMTAKKCDIAAEGMTITDARKDAVNFSLPYFGVSQTLAVPADSTITSLNDTNGKKLGVEASATGEEYATANQAEYGYQIVSFDDAATLLNSLLSGRTDAVLFDAGYVGQFVKDNAGAKIAAQIATGEVYGFAAAKDDNGAALIAIVDQVLQKANSDGTYLQIYQKWIDPTATSASLPPAS